MKRIFIIGLLFLYAFTLYSQSNIRYYFKTLDIQDGLSQNTVNAILQDKQGFMWFGTKDGLNRFDGLSFRIFKKENSALGNNFITALHEDKEGNIWVGTDAGVYVYNPLLEDFTVFDRVSDTGDMISRAVTRIESDEDSDIWISVDYQGLIVCIEISVRTNWPMLRVFGLRKNYVGSVYMTTTYIIQKIILRHCFPFRILKEKSLLKMISLILGLWVPIIVGISVLLMV